MVLRNLSKDSWARLLVLWWTFTCRGSFMPCSPNYPSSSLNLASISAWLHHNLHFQKHSTLKYEYSMYPAPRPPVDSVNSVHYKATPIMCNKWLNTKRCSKIPTSTSTTSYRKSNGSQQVRRTLSWIPAPLREIKRHIQRSFGAYFHRKILNLTYLWKHLHSL